MQKGPKRATQRLLSMEGFGVEWMEGRQGDQAPTQLCE